MAAGIKLTTTDPFLTLLPLAILAFITIAAFIHAIHSNFKILAALWTPCNGPPLLSQPGLPTPLCFAIHFFQSAHATLRGRLEQAIIVSFLAGLATITAVESDARVQYRAENEPWSDEKRRKNENKVEEARKDWGEGLISQKIIANLTIPWLLYSLALGALVWEGIIIPAFLYRQHEKPQSQGPSQLQPWTGETSTNIGVSADARSLTIPLSIALGLFLPAALMLFYPSAPLPIVLFLLFPLWVTLIQTLLRPLTSRLTRSNNTSETLLFIPPIIASTLAHMTLLLSLITTTSSAMYPSNDATATALLLLELDHAAIYLATLYWIYIKSNTNTNNVLATLAASIALGPGAGICVGWLYDHRGKAKESGESERRKGGKATGCFFEL